MVVVRMLRFMILHVTLSLPVLTFISASSLWLQQHGAIRGRECLPRQQEWANADPSPCNMSWLSMSRLKHHYSQICTSPKAVLLCITKCWYEQYSSQASWTDSSRLNGGTGSRFKLDFPYTGGRFLCLVALEVPHTFKFSFFQRSVRVLEMREFRPTDLG